MDDVIWLMLFMFAAYLFIFWIFCLVCQWDDNKTIWQKLAEKKKLAMLAVISIFLLMFTFGVIGYKLRRMVALDKSCPSCPQINWKQKYNEEIIKQEKVFKKHPRLKKYFK